MDANFRGGAIAVERRTLEAARVANNSPQVVTHYHRHITTGIGRARVVEPVVFDLPFLVEPTLTDGLAVIKADESGDFHDPEGGATVRAWTTDANKHFTGALISVYVHCEPTGAQADSGGDLLGGDLILGGGAGPQAPQGVRCAHTLAFTGPAYKKLDDQAQTELVTSFPRPVSYGRL